MAAEHPQFPDLEPGCCTLDQFMNKVHENGGVFGLTYDTLRLPVIRAKKARMNGPLTDAQWNELFPWTEIRAIMIFIFSTDPGLRSEFAGSEAASDRTIMFTGSHDLNRTILPTQLPPSRLSSSHPHR